MRALVQRAYGSPREVLRVEEIERPVAKDDEVLVRVRAASVHADVWHGVTGTPKSWRIMTGWSKPKNPVPGTDLAGVVESTGAQVTRFKPGDEVFGATVRRFELANSGAFAEYAAAPEASLALKPGNVTFEQAASVPASGYIAWSQLSERDANMTGQRVLVNGAGGGVGTIALQILKARGAHVTAVDAGPKLEGLRSLGADAVIDYKRNNFTTQGIEYDLIFDVPSNLSFRECKRALKPRGLYIWIGHEHYAGATGGFFGRGFPQMFRLLAKAILRDPNLPKMDFPPAIPRLEDAIAALRDWMADGTLVPLVEQAFPLESAGDAFRLLEEGKVLGKVVLVP